MSVDMGMLFVASIILGISVGAATEAVYGWMTIGVIVLIGAFLPAR